MVTDALHQHCHIFTGWLYTQSRLLDQLPIPRFSSTEIISYVSNISTHADVPSSALRASNSADANADTNATTASPATCTATPSITTATAFPAASDPPTSTRSPASPALDTTSRLTRPENPLHPLLLHRSPQAPSRGRSPTYATTRTLPYSSSPHDILPQMACSTPRDM